MAISRLNPVYQTPLITEYTPAAPKAPANRDPMYGFLRDVEDDALDVVGCGGTAAGCKAERQQYDRISDAKLREAHSLALAEGRAHIAILIEEGLFWDEKEETPIARMWACFDDAVQAGRQIVNKIERFLSPPRQRAGKGRVTR